MAALLFMRSLTHHIMTSLSKCPAIRYIPLSWFGVIYTLMGEKTNKHRCTPSRKLGCGLQKFTIWFFHSIFETKLCLIFFRQIVAT